MADKIGVKVVIEGESEFKSSIASINSEMKTLTSELKLVESEFRGQANTMAALTAKGNVLSNSYDKQQQKITQLKSALDNAKTAQSGYGTSVEQAKSKLAATEAALTKLQSSTGKTAAEEKKLTAELANQKNDLANAERGYKQTSSAVNDWQQKLNSAKVAENKLNDEVKKNSKYLDEAKHSANGCATSIDNMGKQSKEAAEKTGLLSKIFAGGFLANIATQALSAVVSKLKQLVTAAFSTADELEKLSSVTGFTTSELQKMSYIGDDLGVSLETQSSALKKLINNMSSAQSGSGTAYEAFKKLKVEYEDGNKKLLNSNEVYGKVIDALGKMTNETERNAAAQDIFGKSATELNPLVEAGSKALQELGNQAEATGAIMSEDAVDALDATGDSIEHLKQSAESFVGETLAGIIDGSKTAAETMSDLSTELDKQNSIDALIDKYRRLTAEVSDSSTNSAELSNKTAELERTKQDLIEASGGVVTAMGIENGSFDSQVGTLETLTQAEKEYLKFNLASTIIDNTGAEGKKKLAEATKEQADAQARVIEYTQRVKELTDKIASGKGTSGDAAKLDRWRASLDWASTALGDADAKLVEVGASSTAAQEAAQMLVDEGLATIPEAAAMCGKSVEEFNTILGDSGDAVAGTSPAIDDITTAMDGLIAAYDEAKTAAEASLDSTVSLWGEMDTEAVTSAADVQAALDSQMQWLTDYKTNLDALANRKIEGVDTTELVKSLSDGSTESAAILAGLATATDGEVKKIADSLANVDKLKDDTAGTMAETTTGFGKNLDVMKQKLNDTVNDMDMSTDAGKAAKATMQAYIDKINASKVAATSAAAKVAAAVKAALGNTGSTPTSNSSVLPTMPFVHYAGGSDYSADTYIAGEEGPELIVGRAGSRVYTAEQTAAIMARANAMGTAMMSAAGNSTVKHTGVIEVRGVNNSGELVGAYDIIVANLRKEARM